MIILETDRLALRTWKEEDFDHPRLDKSHPLCHHVLYRLKRTNNE